MKKSILSIFTLLLCTFFLAQAQTNVTLIAEDQHHITLKIRFDEVQLEAVPTDRGLYQVPLIKECVSALSKGYPDIPVLGKSIVLDDHLVGKFEVLSAEYTLLENIKIAPSKGNLYRDVFPSNIPFSFGEVYQKDAFYPENIVSAKAPYIFRDFKGQRFQVYSMQYNPVQQQAKVFSEVVIRIDKVNDAHAQPLMRQKAQQGISTTYEHLYQTRFVNYQSHQSRYEYINELGGMLVICPSLYNETLQPFLDWKNQKGHRITLSNTEDIGTSVEDIKAHIADQYLNNNIVFVLLVGDEDQVDAELYLGAGDGYCDNCYGYIDGDDHYPEVLIGRFPVHNAAELVPVLTKTLEYETNPYIDNPDWFSTAIGVASQEGAGIGDNDESDYEHMNIIKETLLAYTYNNVYEFYEGDQSAFSPTPNHPTADSTSWPDAPEIVAVMEGMGASLYNYVGHGAHGLLATGNMTNDVLDSLTNDHAWPYCIAVACCVGDFDESDGTGDCFGEKWIKAIDETNGRPAGGIGGLFASVLQSWAPPMSAQDEMNRLITQTGAYQLRQSVAAISLHGSSKMIDDYAEAGEEMMDTWCLFGDPSLELRTTLPHHLQATHVDSVFIGTNTIRVACDTEGAMVGLFYQGSNIGYGIVENGEALIPVEGLSVPADLTVTATAFNTIPYQGTIHVVPSEGAYVIMSDYTIDDSEANNNQLADYTENIQLNINLRNVGLELAPEVSAVLSTEDENIILTKDTETWGNLDPDSDMLISAAFAFTVADFIENKHSVPFELTISSGDDTWTSPLAIQLYAPELEVGTFSIDDSEWGNGNGWLDAGEQVRIMVENRNMGGSAAYDMEGVLTSSNTYISILENAATLSHLSENGAMETTSFVAQIAEDIPEGTNIDLMYEISDGLYTANSMTTFRANLIIEGFESEITHPFDFEASYPWFVSTTEPYDGAYCLESADIDNNQTSEFSLRIDVQEAGTFSYSVRTSTEQDWDFLFFYIDEEEIASWSGNEPWTEVSYDLTAGPHTLRWAYVKDEYISSGEDACYIDNVIMPPYSEIVSVREQLPSAAVQLFPNPTSDRTSLRISLDKASPTQVQILNTQGQVIQTFAQQKAADTHHYTIDTATLPAGMYMILIQTNHRFRPIKLVVE